MPMLWYLPIAFIPPKLPCQPLTHHVLANRWLTMLPLCSTPLIALLVAGEDWRSFLVGTLFFVGISPYYLVYLNAPIYLVMGGRLGLLPSVLFHSCRPSFRHIGVMFPDFAFLTRLGYNGNPLTVRLEENSSSNAQLWFYHSPPSLFFPWVSRTQASSLFKPPGQCSSECWSNMSAAGGHQGQLWAGLPEPWTIRRALRTRYVQLL